MARRFRLTSPGATIIAALIGAVVSIVAIVVSVVTKADQNSLSELFESYRPVMIQSGKVVVEPREKDKDGRLSELARVPCEYKVQRRFVRHVKFDKPFPFDPRIVVGLNQFDISPVAKRKLTEEDCFKLPNPETNSVSTRLLTYATNISKTGFEMVFQTWNRTAIHQAHVHWIAYSQIGSP